MNAAGAPATMPVRHFLNTIAPVIAREPGVFVDAMANTCNVEEASGALGSNRAVILLKPKVTIFTAAATVPLGGWYMIKPLLKHMISHLD